ncbi:MAG: pilus assembly protein PilM [Actinomycetia bacterium]|nr:pilus assembly protein PilM [Actinomycetes bacterium]
MSKRIVGVSIETALIKAVEVRIRRGRATVVRAGTVELPDGAVDWGTIVDAEAVTDAFRRLWAEASFSSRRIAVVIDSHHVLTRQTELPVLSEASYREALRYDLAELMSYDPDEAIVDAIELSTRTGDSGLEHRLAIAVAVHEQTLTVLQEVAASAGLEVVHFDLGALALDRVVEGADPGQSGEGASSEVGSTPGPRQRTPIGPGPPEGEDGQEVETRVEADVLIHVEADNTTAVVRTDDGIQFLRTVSVGTGDQSSALASELESQLETILTHDPATAGGSGAMPYGQYRHPVSEALRGTLEYLTTTNPGIRPTRILLSGSESHEHLSAIVAGGTDLPILPSRLSVGWVADGSDVSDYLLEVGTALTAAGDDTATTLDLRSNRELASAKTQRERRVGIGLAALVALACSMQVGQRWLDLADARVAADQAEAQLASLDSRADSLAGAAATRAHHTQATARLQQALEGDIDLVGVIDSVVGGLPANASLSTLRVQATPAGSTVPLDEGLGAPVGIVDLQAHTPTHLDTADWLRAFQSVEYLDGEEISGSSLSTDPGSTAGSSFSARAAIVSTAWWQRSGLYGGGPLGSTDSAGSGEGP